MTPPESARAVIVGGGVMGASLAYHLARLGWRDLVLVEQNQMTSGSTWHAGGLVGMLRRSLTETRMCVSSAALYSRLVDDTGIAAKYVECGSLRVARTAERLSWLHRHAVDLSSVGVDAHVVSPAESKRIYGPLLRTDDLFGALYIPKDGTVSPSDLTQSLLRGAMRDHAALHLVEGARVARLLVTSSISGAARRVRGVQLENGDIIRSDLVVNCAGIWARNLFAASGARVPLHACEHFYTITRPINGIRHAQPVLRDPDGGFSMRSCGDRQLLITCFEREARPVFSHGPPASFAFRLLPDDLAHVRGTLDSAAARVPAIAATEIERCVNGPESFTPDARPIIGPDPSISGLFIAAGFNSSGIAAAGGVGEALAHWMAHNEPPFDMSDVSPSRFDAFHSNPQFLKERVAETLGMHCALPLPRAEGMASARGVRRSPLHGEMVARGAVWGHRHGHEKALVADGLRMGNNSDNMTSTSNINTSTSNNNTSNVNTSNSSINHKHHQHNSSTSTSINTSNTSNIHSNISPNISNINSNISNINSESDTAHYLALFSAARRELSLARSSAVLFDLSWMTKLLVTGRHASQAITRLSGLAFGPDDVIGGGSRVRFFPVVDRAGGVAAIAHAVRGSSAVELGEDEWVVVVHSEGGSESDTAVIKEAVAASTQGVR